MTCQLMLTPSQAGARSGDAAGPKIGRLGLSVLFSNPRVPSLSHGAVGLAGSESPPWLPWQPRGAPRHDDRMVQVPLRVQAAVEACRRAGRRAPRILVDAAEMSQWPCPGATARPKLGAGRLRPDPDPELSAPLGQWAPSLLLREPQGAASGFSAEVVAKRPSTVTKGAASSTSRAAGASVAASAACPPSVTFQVRKCPH